MGSLQLLNESTIFSLYLRKRLETVKLAFKFLLLIGIVLLACSRDESYKVAEDQIVAKVGQRIITAEEFKNNFEFSVSTLRVGLNPRRTYLNYMIKELLLANEGYRQGLHQNPYVTSRVTRRRKNNLLEAFVHKYVHDKVNIPEADIQEAVKKSSVTWKMLIWPTPNLEEAQTARLQASNSTLSDFIDDQLSKAEVKLVAKSHFETGWIDFLDLQPEILEKVVNLEIGKTSAPFPYGNGYAVAEVLDIHRVGITENQLMFGPRRKRIKARLHNIESDRIMHSLMDSILTPQNIRVKGAVVEKLATPLFEWIKAGLPKEGSVFKVIENPPDSLKEGINQIKRSLDQVLITSQYEKKTVQDFIEHIDYYRSELNRSKSFDDFKDRLVTEIGRMIKNEIFIEIAEKKNLDESAIIVEDLRVWERKWTYDVFRNHSVRELKVSAAEMQNFFKYRWRELSIADVDTTRFYKYKSDVYNALLHEKQLAALESEIEALRKRYPIQINAKVLEELELIDSLKSSQTTYFLRKKFTGEAMFPTVDLKWLHL